MNSSRYGGNGTTYYRKSALDYFQYAAVDTFTTSFGYCPKIYAEVNFLKEGLTTGITWNSPEYEGMASFGQRIFLIYNLTCIDADTTVTVGSTAFTEV